MIQHEIDIPLPCPMSLPEQIRFWRGQALKYQLEGQPEYMDFCNQKANEAIQLWRGSPGGYHARDAMGATD